jgi:hypothetical protein
MRATWSTDGRKWILNLRQHPEDFVFGTGQRKPTDAGKTRVGLLIRERTVELPLVVEPP